MPPPPPPPPPGPPPPSSTGPPKLSKSETNNRSALLGDICKGKALKKSSHLTVDKSKPVLGSEGKSGNKFGTISGGLNHSKPYGGPNSSTSTIGPAGGRGGKSNAPPGLADLFGGGVPRLKGAGGSQPPAQQPPRVPVQNGFKSNAPRPPGPPRVRPPNVNPSPPPPPPASAKINYNQDSINLQESLTGRGANGRITGLGITSPPPPPPPPSNHQSSMLLGKNLPVRPALPNNKPMNIRAPPPPPVRSSENKMFPPPPPPPISHSSSQDSQHRQGKNGLPRVPGGPPPPPPPIRSTNPPPPPRQTSTSSELQSSHVPNKDHNLSDFEMNFKFNADLPPVPSNFRKSSKIYPSVVAKSKMNGPTSRPCPPPPPPA